MQHDKAVELKVNKVFLDGINKVYDSHKEEKDFNLSGNDVKRI
ncbi:MAG: hypothetical protein ACTSR8_11175 [Promethearchaeota archaeon]